MAELSPTFNEVLPILGECSIDILYGGEQPRGLFIFFLPVKYFISRYVRKRNSTFYFLFVFFFSFSFVTRSTRRETSSPTFLHRERRIKCCASIDVDFDLTNCLHGFARGHIEPGMNHGLCRLLWLPRT